MHVLQAEPQAHEDLTAQDSTQLVAMFDGERRLRNERPSLQSETLVEATHGAGPHRSTTEGSAAEVRPLQCTCSASGLGPQAGMGCSIATRFVRL